MKSYATNNQNSRMKAVLNLLGLSVIFLSLSACNSDMSDLDNYFASERTKTAMPIAAIPELKPYLRYVYPVHEKDPFDVRMLIPEAAPQIVENGIKLDVNRVKEFLEGFPLDGLDMVGTVNEGNTLWALIKTPDGGVQSIKKDNFLGQNYGRVLSITDTEIEIKELVPNGSGGYKERDIQISLKDSS